MIFGMTPFTFGHVVLSLVGIGSGFVVVIGLLTAKRLDGWTALGGGLMWSAPSLLSISMSSF
jgi:hypothetical protein